MEKIKLYDYYLEDNVLDMCSSDITVDVLIDRYNELFCDTEPGKWIKNNCFKIVSESQKFEDYVVFRSYAIMPKNYAVEYRLRWGI